jgi:23S rRNA (pseudouridine1915-N3)-methyltransferase
VKWKIISIGKPALAYAKSGIDEYLGRVGRYTKVELVTLKEVGREENARRLLDASEGCFRLVLDETGKKIGSEAFAKKLETWEMDRVKTVAVLIGGADGHTDETRRAADFPLSLSEFTIQHELALVVFLEQLYRACTIRRGEPYHR